MSKKRLTINIDEDLYSIILKNSTEERLSASAYIYKILKENIEVNSNFKELYKIENEHKNNSKSRVWIDAETTSILRKKSAEVGLNETAYVRNLIHTKDFNLYRIQTDDIELLIEEISKTSNALATTVNLIIKYSEGLVTDADAKRILRNSDEIKKMLKQIVNSHYDARKKQYLKLVNQYEDYQNI